MLDNGQLEDLAQDFYSCKPLEGKGDVYQFVSNLAGSFMGVVQYNLEVPGQNITGLCQQMTVSSDSYSNLRHLYKVSCFKFKFAHFRNDTFRFLIQFYCSVFFNVFH